MSKPTKLKKMKLNSVDFVRRGANPVADIALKKSYDAETEEEQNQSFFKSLRDSIADAIEKAFGKVEDIGDYMDVAKAEQDLTTFTDVLGESFSSIMKDDTLNQEERIGMICKSLSEFNETLDDYLSSFDTLEKSFYEEDSQTAEVTKKSSTQRKGDAEMKFYEDVDKSRLSKEEAALLDALVAKAKTEEEPFEKEDKGPTNKVNPAKAQEEEEENLPPAVKKALEEVEEMKKSYEMRELTSIAKKYEGPLGKKAEEVAKTLYDLKKSGESNYNAYIAALDAQVDMVEKSGLFAEVGKSGNFNFTSVAKSEPETKIETIAKGYLEKDPNMTYEDAITKAWENNPDLMEAYEVQAGF